MKATFYEIQDKPIVDPFVDTSATPFLVSDEAGLRKILLGNFLRFRTPLYRDIKNHLVVH